VYLQRHGAEVELTDDGDRSAFRADVGVPDDVRSCHTAMVDGYAIEGHVPVEAIVQLLDERPAAVGLALPGMPSDSPGMGGDASTWVQQQVLLIAHDGTLSSFDY
jgi:hypothetical protein